MDPRTPRPPCLAGIIDRRAAVKAALGIVLSATFVPCVAAQESEAKDIRPQPGDAFVLADGSRQGEAIAAADLVVGGPRVTALPMDPKTGVVRDGSRLNRVLLVRFDPEVLDEETRKRSAAGVVAYSAICTHEACEVTDWQDETRTFWCPCHGSRFDPRAGARVVEGPAPRRLAGLPLGLSDGVLTAVGRFLGHVGVKNR